jgi:hypothetical protein
MDDPDFVEVPAEVERDDERHAAFLNEQVESFRAKIAARKERRKLAAAAAAAAGPVQEEPEAPIVKKKKKKKSARIVEPEEDEEVAPVVGAAPVNAKKQKRELEDDQLQRKLMGARFRLLNEQLYTIKSEEAVTLFGEHPELFEVYHQGFAEQVEKWPENPLDEYIATVRKLAAKNKQLVVADFGCGDGRLGLELAKVARKIHSFDLVAKAPHVTACDMAHVPLEKSSVHVAIFCLALMGTNWEDFVREAHRVLKVGGELLITEVTSRIQDPKQFVSAIRNLGFNFGSQNSSNTHFTRFVFSKNNSTPKSKPSGVVLGVCKYKKR